MRALSLSPRRSRAIIHRKNRERASERARETRATDGELAYILPTSSRSFHASLRLCLASTYLASPRLVPLFPLRAPRFVSSHRAAPRRAAPHLAAPSPRWRRDAEGGINWRGVRSLMISPRSRRRSSFGNRPCIYLRPYVLARMYSAVYNLRMLRIAAARP